MRAEPMTFFLFIIFFLQYGEIYPDSLWVFTPLVSPAVIPHPRLPLSLPKNLWLSTEKPGMMIEQRDYVTVNYSVTSKLRAREVKKAKKAVCFTVLRRQHRQKHSPSKSIAYII